MFKTAKLESQKELFLKSNHPTAYQRYTLRKQKPITEKITNITFTKEYLPKNIEVSSRQKYLNNILENSLKPYNDQKTFRKLSKIHRSRNNNNKTFDNENSSLSQSRSSYNFRSLSNYSKCKTEYKIKRPQSFFSNRTYNKEDVLRKTNNSRIRKLYSMASDIFNLDESSTNLIQHSSFYNNNNYNNNIEYSVDTIHFGNENNYKNKNIKNFSVNDEYDDNSYISSSKGLLEKGNCEFSIQTARRINLNKLKKYKKNVENKKFNKLSLLLNKDFSHSDFVPFLHKIKSKTKTNESNIESVNYDIISNKSNNLYDKYNKFSNKKANSSQYDNYEIIIPKNYNKLDGSKLKNLLHSQGIHFFGFREDAKVAGDRGKFKFKIRKSITDKNNSNINNIEKLSKKLNKIFNVKLKKYDEINERKTTEITKKYGAEVVSNHLQTEETKNKLLKR